MMEDQIVGVIAILAVMAAVGSGSNSKRRWGENIKNLKRIKNEN